jgi:hypothetical protein
MSKKKWIDEAGNEIPEHRVSAAEKLAEKHSAALLKAASTINQMLRSIKEQVHVYSNEVFDLVMLENNTDVNKRKGNFTWYNFDRSIKIEVNVSERVVFDEMLIHACQEKLMTFLKKSLTKDQQFIESLVLDAFQTRAGKLDTKKIMYLKKHKERINNPLYTEAMDLLDKSIRRPDKKMYFRIWKRNSNGEYENIELNFSSI